MVNTQEIHVVGVSKRYGSTVALDDVSIELRSGITGLLGPNGAGKTTLLRILATVLAPDRGDIDIFGLRPDRASGRAEIRRNLGYTPQEPGFHRSFTTFEFVDYLAILKEWGDRNRRRDEVRRVIALVGLETQMHVQIKKLSGGMRRRVADRASVDRQPGAARSRRADRRPRPRATPSISRTAVGHRHELHRAAVDTPDR